MLCWLCDAFAARRDCYVLRCCALRLLRAVCCCAPYCAGVCCAGCASCCCAPCLLRAAVCCAGCVLRLLCAVLLCAVLAYAVLLLYASSLYIYRACCVLRLYIYCVQLVTICRAAICFFYIYTVCRKGRFCARIRQKLYARVKKKSPTNQKTAKTLRAYEQKAQTERRNR